MNEPFAFKIAFMSGFFVLCFMLSIVSKERFQAAVIYSSIASLTVGALVYTWLLGPNV